MPNKRKPPVKKAIRPQVAYSSEEDEAGGFTVTGAEAVLGSDGAPPASTGEALPRELPCTLNGINAGLGGGALGYVFGFGSQLIKHRGKGRFKACTREGWSSAKTFAIMGGLYAGVNCFMKRLRQKDDAFNGAASGCATGLVLAWGALSWTMFKGWTPNLPMQLSAMATSASVSGQGSNRFLGLNFGCVAWVKSILGMSPFNKSTPFASALFPALFGNCKTWQRFLTHKRKMY